MILLKSRSLGCIVLCVALFSACFKSDKPRADSNANWLKQCEDSSDCEEDLRCICGTCSRFCESNRDCSGFDKSASCVDVATSTIAASCSQDEIEIEVKSCALHCNKDVDCLNISSNLVCEADFCLNETLATLIKRSSDGTEEDPADSGVEDVVSNNNAKPPIDASVDSNTIDAGDATYRFDSDLESGRTAADGPLDGDTDASSVERPDLCPEPDMCKTIGPWGGDDSCEPASETRTECESDGTCDEGICHIDSTCITAGQCDDNGVTTLAISDSEIRDIVVDEDYLYWAEYGRRDRLGNYLSEGKIVRVPIQGGQPETLVEEVYKPFAIWVDDTHLYWSQVGGPEYDRSSENTQFWRIEKTVGSEAQLLIDHLEESLFVQDTDYFYFVPLSMTDSFAFYILPKDGSSPVIERDLSIEFENGEFDALEDRYKSLAVGDDAVYLRVEKDGSSIRLIAVPKDPAFNTRVYDNRYVDVEDDRILGFGGGYLFTGGTYEFVKALDLATDTIYILYQAEDNYWVRDFRYYDDRVVFHSLDFEDTDDDGLLESRIIIAPVPPSGSSADTVEIVALEVEPETGADFYIPDPQFDVSGSGLFWTEPFNDSEYRRRIIRQKDF